MGYEEQRRNIQTGVGNITKGQRNPKRKAKQTKKSKLRIITGP